MVVAVLILLRRQLVDLTIDLFYGVLGSELAFLLLIDFRLLLFEGYGFTDDDVVQVPLQYFIKDEIGAQNRGEGLDNSGALVVVLDPRLLGLLTGVSFLFLHILFDVDVLGHVDLRVVVGDERDWRGLLDVWLPSVGLIGLRIDCGWVVNGKGHPTFCDDRVLAGDDV